MFFFNYSSLLVLIETQHTSYVTLSSGTPKNINTSHLNFLGIPALI